MTVKQLLHSICCGYTIAIELITIVCVSLEIESSDLAPYIKPYSAKRWQGKTLGNW